MNKKELILKIIYTIATIIITNTILYQITKLNILPFKYLILLYLLIISIDIIVFLFLNNHNKKIKIVCYITIIITIIISIITLTCIHKTDNLLEITFSNDKIEISSYLTISLKNKYSDLKELNNKIIGYYNDNNINKILTDNIKITLIEYTDIFELYNDLLEGKIDALIIEEPYLEILAEEYEDIDNTITILNIKDIKTETTIKKEIIKNVKPLNIYLSGSDSRTNTIYNKSRSDVNIIISINPIKKKILIVSIPRDYYVMIHGQTKLKDKLTHAGIYGLDVSTSTIEDLLNIKIDYSIKIGFKMVTELVNLLEGIDIYSDIYFKSTDNDLEINKGINHLNGEQTLSYVRERHALNGGDRTRIINQQTVLKEIITKISNNKSILLKYEELLQKFYNLYYTNIPKEVITLYVKNQLNNPAKWQIETYQLNGSNSKQRTYTSPNYLHYVMLPYPNDITTANQKIIDNINTKKVE